MKVVISISKQTLHILDEKSNFSKSYLVSTGKNGAGEEFGSGMTPRGHHMIRAKIGANASINTVFVGRRATGEFYTPEMRVKYPERDWILTRILWLSGLELGKNRLGKQDTMRRYIYIHGSPDDVLFGVAGSKGCIRMRNEDIIELFERVSYGDSVFICPD
jgi:L,D-transpeptidase YbiS